MKEQNEKHIGILNGIIYGVCMGIFEVVPGISGGTLAFILGIYETLINAISNIKKNFKKNIKILLPILIGMGIGVYCFSFILSFLNKKYPMELNFWLTGLIIGIIPSITIEAFSLLNPHNSNENILTKNKIKFFKTSPLKLYISIFSFFLMLSTMIIVNYLSFKLKASQDIVENLNFYEFIRFFIVGSISALCLMLPGISGSLIMLVFGTYYSVIEAIHKLNFKIIAVVGFGVLFGLFMGSKIISYFLKHFKAATFFAILGLIVGSSISPFLSFLKSCSFILNFKFLLIHGIFSIFTLALGCVFSVSFSTRFKKSDWQIVFVCYNYASFVWLKRRRC